MSVAVDLHRLCAVTQQQVSQLRSHRVPSCQTDSVLVKSVFHRSSLPKIPLDNTHQSTMSVFTPREACKLRITFLTDLWKFQSNLSVMSPLLPVSSFISSCLLGGLILHTDPELPSMLAVTMSS